MAEVHIFTDGPIGSDYPEMIGEQLKRVGNATKIIHHLSSPGGNVYAGYEGFHKLISLGIPIDTIVEGQAQSMGSFIMLASKKTGGKIKVLNPSRIMIHNPKFNVEGFGQNGYADSDMLRNGAEELAKIEEEMASIYAEAMSSKREMPIDQVKAMMKKETYMSAKEAVELGLADEVISSVDTQQNQKLKAVALGLKQAETKNVNVKMEKQKKGVLARLGEMLIKADASHEVSAVDMPIKGGGVLSVEGEAAEVGYPAMLDGAPAPDGAYELEDGSTIKVAGGVITEIVPAQAAAAPQPVQPNNPNPAPTPSPDPVKMENDKLKEELAALKAEKEKQAQAAKEAELQKAVAMAQEEIKELKKKTVGDDSKPAKPMEYKSAPFASAGTSDEQLSIKASRSFLADNFPHFERYYNHGGKRGRFSDGTELRDYRRGGPEAVSILETNLGYTWNGVLDTELLYKPTLMTPAIADVFTVDTGAADSKRYHIAPTFDKVTKPYTGCGQSVTGSSFDITSKRIQLKPFRIYESWCKDDFTDQLSGSFNVLAQEWLKSGNASFDPAGTPIDRMITDLLIDAGRIDLWRRASFADTGSSDNDYNQIDGLFTNLFDQSGASNYCVRANKTNFGTAALSAGDAYNELLSIWNNSSLLLKQEGIAKGKGKFMVTQTIWDNLYTSYTATGAVTELAFKQAMDGIGGQLTFRGIPVVPIPVWDSFLAETDNPYYNVRKHIIIFTVKENHILGFHNPSDTDKFDSWYDKTDHKRYYEANYSMGFIGALHCDLTIISY